MLCHRFKGFADRLEQIDIGHQRQGHIDKGLLVIWCGFDILKDQIHTK